MVDPWPASLQNSFDLVHSRYSLAGAGTYPLRKVVEAEVGLLKPGGWIQLEEMDLARTIQVNPNGPAAQDTYVLLSEIFRILGAGDGFASKIKGWLIETGLVDVQEHELIVDMGVNATAGRSEVEKVRMMGTEAMARTVQGLVDGSARELPVT